MTKTEYRQKMKKLQAEHLKEYLKEHPEQEPHKPEFSTLIDFTEMNYDNYYAYLNLLSGCADLTDEELLSKICTLQDFTDNLKGIRRSYIETSKDNNPSPFSPNDLQYDTRISQWFDVLYKFFYEEPHEESESNYTVECSEYLLKDDIAKHSVPSYSEFRAPKHSLIVFCENDENINRLYNLFIQSKEELKITNVYKISEADRSNPDNLDLTLNYRDVLILKGHGNENITYQNNRVFILIYDVPFESERVIRTIQTIRRTKKLKRKKGKKGEPIIDERGAISSASFVACKHSIDEHKVRMFKSYADALTENDNYEAMLSSVDLKIDLQNFRNALIQAFQKREERKKEKEKDKEILDRLIFTADFESVISSKADFNILVEDYSSIILYETFERLRRHEITEEECKILLKQIYNDLYDWDEPTVYFSGKVRNVKNYPIIGYHTYRKIKLGEYSNAEAQELYRCILKDENPHSAIKEIKRLLAYNALICLVGNTDVPDLVKKALYAQNDLEYELLDFS